MSRRLTNESVIVISSDDDFESDEFDFKRSSPVYRKRQRELKDSSVKRRHVDFETKIKRELLWKQDLQTQEISFDNDLHQQLSHQKSSTLQKESYGARSCFRQRGHSLGPDPKLPFEPDRDLLDVKCSSLLFDYKSINEIRNALKNRTLKLKLDEFPMLKSGEAIWKKSVPHACQNERTIQSANDTELVIMPPYDLQSDKGLCQTRTKVESCSWSRKTDERVEPLSKLDLLINSLKLKKIEWDALSSLDHCEKSCNSPTNYDVESKEYQEANWSKLQTLNCNFTNQNDIKSREFCSSNDDFSFSDNLRDRDGFASGDVLPSSTEEHFDTGRVASKRKPLRLEISSDTSSGDDLDTELPDLETTGIQSADKPLKVFSSTSNVDTLETFTKSSRNIQHISLPPAPSAVPNKTEVEILHEVDAEEGCSISRRICHLHLKSPLFLPSSNSSLKHCYGDCRSAGSSDVSEFSMFKVSLIMGLLDEFDEFWVNTASPSSRKRSKRRPICDDPPDEEADLAGSSYAQVSLMYRNLTNIRSQPTVALTATLLKHLSHSRTLNDSLLLHSALKGAACLHPHRSALPFSSEMFLQALETISNVDRNHQQYWSSVLSLDFMVSCLEMEFIGNFQAISLRQSRKTKLFKLFDSDFALQRIRAQLSVACQRYDPKDRDVIRILTLLRRLLGIAGAVAIAGIDGVPRVASMLFSEYRACEQLSVRVALLESISFPFHRFAIVRQVLESWRFRSMSCSLRSLMVSDVKDLLDAFFTDRFFSMLPMKEMSAEMAEELAMLLYILVESYLHTKRDCLTSSYWEKIGLIEKAESGLDPSSLSLIPDYVDRLRSFLSDHISPAEKLSRKTCLYLIKLECLADLCLTQ